MTPTDRDARINKFVHEFGYGDSAMDEEFRSGVVELLTDLGCAPKSPPKSHSLLAKPGVRKFRLDEE
jgi:hypothetical protein